MGSRIFKSRRPRVVLVTGSSRGIGAACAEAFFGEGDKVVIVSRGARELARTARRIARKSGENRLLPISGDVGSEGFAREIFAKAHEKFGPMDILVNNAAILIAKDFPLTTAEDWDQTMSANLRGAFLFSREFFRQVPHPAPPKRRLIINVNSLGGLPGTKKFPGLTAYVASKFGLAGLTEALAVEGKKRGIEVVGIAPGAVATALSQKASTGLRAGASPQDIARIIVELSESSASPWLSGVTIPLYTNR